MIREGHGIFSFIVLITALLFSTAASGDEVGPNPCLRCHEDVYVKAVSYRYRHGAVMEQCTLCHVVSETEDNIIAGMDFPALQREWLIYLDQLSEGQDYQAEVIVTDSDGRSSAPDSMHIVLKDAWETEGQRPSMKLEKLSGVMIDEIKNQGFATAVISWDTDSFATTEIEYRFKGERPATFKIKGLYTKDHRVMLDGLKHKSTCYFRAVSRDIFGNTLQSEEYSFDTSEEFSRIAGPGVDDSTAPVVEHIQVFRGPGSEGMYLKVSASKPSGLSVKIREVRKMDEKHGAGLLPPRYSRIDVCYKCHHHDSSHPVGVRASGPKVRTPDGLPTIEEGTITCVTCHDPHGGERLHFTRFDYRQDLCLRCHLQEYSRLASN